MSTQPNLEMDCQELSTRQPCDAWDICWQRLYREFGRPTSSTKKIYRWQLLPGIVEIALIDSRSGMIVAPINPETDEVPYFAEMRAPKHSAEGQLIKKGRHSNVGSFSPSISWDRPVIYMRPQSVWELERIIEIISGLIEGRTILDLEPPDHDPPLQSLLPNSSPSLDGPSSSVRRLVYHRDGGRCRRCGSQEDLEFDHIIPRSRGGSNSANNLELLCQPCNARKSDTI